MESDTQPMPLQLFVPLQLFLAVLHSEVPLQEFTPLQCTVALSAAIEKLTIPALNSIAAAAAIAAFDNLFICMIEPSLALLNAAIVLHFGIDLIDADYITHLSKLMLNQEYQALR